MGASASTTAPSASSAPQRCRRSSATTGSRRSSPSRQQERLLQPQWRQPTADPLAALATALRRDRRGPAAGPPAGRRSRHLPGRRPAGQDRPHEHGPQPGGTRPFLDPVVAELALALPTKLKVRGLAKKRLLRQAAAPLIPSSITKGRKRGFSIPAAAWLRGELEPLARDLLSPERTRAQGYFEPGFVTELLEDHVARRQDYSRQLWGLMSFSLWAEQVGGAAGAAAPGRSPMPRRPRDRASRAVAAARRGVRSARMAALDAGAAEHRPGWAHLRAGPLRPRALPRRAARGRRDRRPRAQTAMSSRSRASLPRSAATRPQDRRPRRDDRPTDRILLVQERDDGGWAMPGGWADVGESAAEAAVRETREEAGCRCGRRS